MGQRFSTRRILLSKAILAASIIYSYNTCRIGIWTSPNEDGSGTTTEKIEVPEGLGLNPWQEFVNRVRGELGLTGKVHL